MKVKNGSKILPWKYVFECKQIPYSEKYSLFGCGVSECCIFLFCFVKVGVQLDIISAIKQQQSCGDPIQAKQVLMLMQIKCLVVLSHSDDGTAVPVTKKQ